MENKKTPMLPVRYSDGTPCDINSNKPRETIVYYGTERERKIDICRFKIS